ncbi:hypothetical protein N7527_006811 [Penicillium freii]|nr:hypothetical protein N7527_006811 [Penicillium freii]
MVRYEASRWPDEIPLTLPELTLNLEPAVPGQSRASSVLVGPDAYSTSGAKIQQTKRAKQAGRTGLLEDGALQRFTSGTWVVMKPTSFSPTEDSFLAVITGVYQAKDTCDYSLWYGEKGGADKAINLVLVEVEAKKIGLASHGDDQALGPCPPRENDPAFSEPHGLRPEYRWRGVQFSSDPQQATQSPYTSRNSSKEVSMEDDLWGPKHVVIRKKLWMFELLDRSCPSSSGKTWDSQAQIFNLEMPIQGHDIAQKWVINSGNWRGKLSPSRSRREMKGSQGRALLYWRALPIRHRPNGRDLLPRDRSEDRRNDPSGLVVDEMRIGDTTGPKKRIVFVDPRGFSKMEIAFGDYKIKF